jgi:hypothetical protein
MLVKSPSTASIVAYPPHEIPFVSWCGSQGRGTYPLPRGEPEAGGAEVVGICPRTLKTRDVAYPLEMRRKAAHLEGISDIPCLQGLGIYPHDSGFGSLGLDAGAGISSSPLTFVSIQICIGRGRNNLP